MPLLGTAGWILFPGVSNSATRRFATLARLDVVKLSYIQTPSDRITDRRCMPYCSRCFVLNDAHVSAPRWKREWLNPTAELCRVHHKLLETVPASMFRLSNHFGAAHRAISRYRERNLFMATGRAALAELMDSISVPMDTAGKFNELQQRLPPTEGRHDVGANETNRQCLASAPSSPSSVARLALRRQTPEIGARCPNWARRDPCGGAQ
jgi:hypothetical protein